MINLTKSKNLKLKIMQRVKDKKQEKGKIDTSKYKVIKLR